MQRSGRLRQFLVRFVRIAWRAPALGVTWTFLAAHTLGLLMMARLRRRRPTTADDTPPVAAPRRDRSARVLLVTPYLLHPTTHGGAIRTTQLLRHLRRDCEVHVLVFDRRGDDPGQRAAIEPLCASLHVHPWIPGVDRWPLWLRSPNEDLFWSPRAACQIRDLVERYAVDVVVLEHTELAQYRRFCGSARTVLVEIDVAFRALQRRRALEFVARFPSLRHYGASFTDWMRLLRYEVHGCRECDQVHTMSERDRDELAALLPDGGRRVRVVPNGVDCAHFRRPESIPPGCGILFVGNFEHLPNVDALCFWMQDVWPILRLRRRDLCMTIVGNAAETFAHLAADPRVRVVGRVADIRPFLHQHRLMVAPLRAGSGTRLKLLEAFASELPVVATALAAEGLSAHGGTHLLVAEAPVAMVHAVEQLLDDDELHRRLSLEARALAESRYDWRLSAQRFLDGVGELVGSPTMAEAFADRAGDAGSPAAVTPTPSVSIVIPTFHGGARLLQVLDVLAAQDLEAHFEVVCVDSGSRPREVAELERRGARVHTIPNHRFDHGLTRDLGASLARGSVVVFLNQDAVPTSASWLRELTAPLLAKDDTLAGVQGGIEEFPEPSPRFFWHSCGNRFYFTRESESWIARFDGLGFSTVNAALDRAVWERHRFGWAPIMEDKKWQRKVVEAGYRIAMRPHATVYHTHVYGLRALVRRCRSEGAGWGLLGEQYAWKDAWLDLRSPHVWRELRRGVRARELRTVAELLFPILRPLALYWGNRWPHRAWR